MCCLKMYFHVRLFGLLAFNVQGMLQMIYLRTCGKDILIWDRKFPSLFYPNKKGQTST